jgi:hypothetical protein
MRYQNKVCSYKHAHICTEIQNAHYAPQIYVPKFSNMLMSILMRVLDFGIFSVHKGHLIHIFTQLSCHNFLDTRVKISKLVNNMCSHCLFPVVDRQAWNKLLSSRNKVDETNRLATNYSNKSDIVCT